MLTEVLELKRGDGVSSLGFRFDLSEGYPGETVAGPDEIYPSVHVRGGRISIFRDAADQRAGPFSSCAEWLTGWVGSDRKRVIHTGDVEALPRALFFAYQGILEVDGQHHRLRFGKGGRAAHPTWHVAARSLLADDDNRGGILMPGDGGAPAAAARCTFELSQAGTCAFVVRART